MAKARKKQPSLPIKFAIGTILAGASYILMGAIGHIYGDTQFSVNWLFFHTLSVLLVSLSLSQLVVVQQLN